MNDYKTALEQIVREGLDGPAAQAVAKSALASIAPETVMVMFKEQASGDTVVGVFSNRQKASEWVDKLPQAQQFKHRYDEWEVT